MKDYFNEIKEYVKSRYNMTIKEEVEDKISRSDILLNLSLDENTQYIYEHYSKFEMVWHNENNQYIGCIHFVPSTRLSEEHKELVETMESCYDIVLDEMNIAEDIRNWYPLFYFPNGDALCLDARNGAVVFYEHEIFEGEINLHGLLIATSINELLEKWSYFHFADVYDWSEVVNEKGIDLNCEMINKYV